MAEQSQAPQPFREIELPDGSDPIEKGILRRIRHLDGTVIVDVAVGNLGEELAERIVEQLRGAALTLEQADHVRILPVAQDDQVIDLPQIEHVLAVASAKGGVGKTSVAVALARSLHARGFRVGLFDADIYGPNVPHLLDVEGPILANDEGQPLPVDADGIQVLSPGLAGGDPPTARRGVIAYGAVENLLAQGQWDPIDVLLVDLPAGSDDVVGAALEYIPISGAVFVTTPFQASVDDTARTITLFEERGVEPVAAVVNMNRFACQCCGEENTLFDDAVDLEVPVTHDLPFDQQLQRDVGHERAIDLLDGLTTTVADFLEALDREIPEDAIDLRGLPRSSQVRQLADELAHLRSGETVIAVVDNPSWVEDNLRNAAQELVGRVARPQHTTKGGVLAVTRSL